MAPDRSSQPEAKPLRLFLAIEVPDQAKDALEEALAPHRGRVPARWTQRSGWHVTVKFLGSTWPRLVEEVKVHAAAAAAAAAPIRTALTVIGAFPNGRRARVLWAGLEDHDGRFGAIAGGLDQALGDYFVPERRAFTPHLSVARLQPPRDIGEFDRELIGLTLGGGPFDAERLVLYRSLLSPSGARYEQLDAWRLGG